MRSQRSCRSARAASTREALGLEAIGMVWLVGTANVSQKTETDAATVDVTRVFMPVLVIKTAGPPQLERMNATNEWIAQNLRAARASGTRLAVVLDVSGRRSRPTTEQQRAMANWLASNRELLEQTCVVWSMVVTSPVLRGVLTAITWFAPFPCPMKVHANVSQGVTWCVEKLVGARVPVAAPLRDARARQVLIESVCFERLS
jgi:hypothetical protein